MGALLAWTEVCLPDCCSKSQSTPSLARCRAVAGQCLRALRLEAHLLLVHHLAELPRSDYQCEEEDTREVDECIGALCRSVARWACLRSWDQAWGISAVPRQVHLHLHLHLHLHGLASGCALCRTALQMAPRQLPDVGVMQCVLPVPG